MEPLRVAVIGAGYWGPNLIRNFLSSDRTDLRWVCDLDSSRAKSALGAHTLVKVTADVHEVLDDDSVEAVAIATPAATHRDLAVEALRAGKHVLIEKPLASSVSEGEEIVGLAKELGLIVMCDHTYCYTSVVQKIRDLVASGAVGDVHYVDSVRINLGIVQPDTDVFWDLAPHDLSILDFVLPESQRPQMVSAQGVDPIGSGRACVGHLSMPLSGNALAHVHVNWLSPTKIRTFVVGGSKRTLVWDDLNPSQRLSIFDRGVDLVERPLDAETKRSALISYRTGDVVAPALPEVEALGNVVNEFVESIRENRPPRTDGESGLRVLRLLDAASRSLVGHGAMETA